MRPALAKLVSRATPSRRSMTVTSWPAWARYQAVVTPKTPPPMTAIFMSSPTSPQSLISCGPSAVGIFPSRLNVVLGDPLSFRNRSYDLDQRRDKGLPYSVGIVCCGGCEEVFLVMRS